ncbi:antibiotic biosynthesis monooxygenase [Nocardia sp. SYP-A9097]|uniref:putative quinol monooxygenase n=1 Tax=Nocardia sp. SYP-A9097 TaxID=2663237 RepID=UPI00129BD815|nr:antibiotic biosynthesis monooxygenase family protein [Nocardia sp. SYP-A9097]MRH93123.1 antibiotic biosynthesis monooxygenase [Nocardia sp. SYP-A9097]
MDSNVRVIADVTADPENADQLGAMLQRFAQVCRTEPGCIGYDVFRSVEQPERFVSIETYVDADAFAAHRDTPHFREIGVSELLPLVTTRDVRVFTDSESVAPKG